MDGCAEKREGNSNLPSLFYHRQSTKEGHEEAQAGHTSHEIAPSAGVEQSPWHEEQDEQPGEAQKLPGEHGRQTGSPPGEYVPAGQLVHVAAPAKE